MNSAEIMSHFSNWHELCIETISGVPYLKPQKRTLKELQVKPPSVEYNGPLVKTISQKIIVYFSYQVVHPVFL